MAIKNINNLTGPVGMTTSETTNQDKEGMDFLANRLIKPTDIDPLYDDTGGSRLDAPKTKFSGGFSTPPIVDKVARGIFSAIGPGKFRIPFNLAMNAPEFISGIFRSGRKIVPKKDELLDIYTDKTKRKKRIVERAKVVKDKELNELINKINLHRAKFGGSAQEMKNNPYSDEIVSAYAKIYNSKDPFKMEYLFSKIGDQNKRISMKATRKGLLNESTEKFSTALNSQKDIAKMDLTTTQTENFLINFKKNNLEATGLEARKAVDDYLKDLSEGQRLRIYKRLEEEKILDDLNFSDLNKGTRATVISDPQIKKYLKEFKLKNLPSDFDFVSKILNPKQKKILFDVNKDVTSIIGTNPAVKDILRENLNRMIRYGLNPKNGNTVEEIMASFQKQISNPKFLKEVVPLISEKVKIQKYITGLNKSFGLNLDSVNISHKKAVARDKELTLAIENIFIGSAKKNTAESAIQKKISSSTDIKEIKKLEGQIKDEGLLDPISPNYPSPDTVSADAAKKIKEGASQAMTGDPLYYKKNGGMMNINDITRSLREF